MREVFVDAADWSSVMAWALAIHGGAGAIVEALSDDHRNAVEQILPRIADVGATTLRGGGSAIDVAEQLTVELEECELFNAGRGAVLSAMGTHELEASIMDGDSGRAGACCGLKTVRNPIRLARQVLERTNHVFVAAPGAEDLAKEWQLQCVPNDWFTTERRRRQLKEFLAAEQDDRMHHATVGAVVCDAEGRLAAATSTGGMTGKLSGRIGDAPLIGAGTWADACVAVSGTGLGERFIRAGTARMVSARVELLGEPLPVAAAAVLDSMPPESGGLIAVDTSGVVSLPFTSQGMYRAWATATGIVGHAIGPTIDGP